MDLSLASPGQFRIFVAFAYVVQSVTAGEHFKGCAQAPQGLMLRLGGIVLFVFPFMGWEMNIFICPPKKGRSGRPWLDQRKLLQLSAFFT